MNKQLSTLGQLISVVALLCSTIFIAAAVFFNQGMSGGEAGAAGSGAVGGKVELTEAEQLAALGLTINEEGQSLFKNNCAQCHAVGEVVVGPDLKNVHERRKKEWVYSFVHNPEGVIKSGDPVAKELYATYKQFMPSFPDLKETEIDAILDYIKVKSALAQSK